VQPTVRLYSVPDHTFEDYGSEGEGGEGMDEMDAMDAVGPAGDDLDAAAE